MQRLKVCPVQGTSFFKNNATSFATLKPHLSPFGSVYCSYQLDGKNVTLYEGKGTKSGMGATTVWTASVTSGDGKHKVCKAVSNDNGRSWIIETAGNVDYIAICAIISLMANEGNQGDAGNPGGLAGAGII